MVCHRMCKPLVDVDGGCLLLRNILVGQPRSPSPCESSTLCQAKGQKARLQWYPFFLLVWRGFRSKLWPLGVWKSVSLAPGTSPHEGQGLPLLRKTWRFPFLGPLNITPKEGKLYQTSPKVTFQPTHPIVFTEASQIVSRLLAETCAI